MPIINLSQDVLDRGRRPKPGWSYATLTSITPSANKKGDSQFLFEFTIAKGPENDTYNKGLYANANFQANALGLNGHKPIPEAINNFATMVAALCNVMPKDLAPDAYDTDKLIDKSCYINIVHKDFEGKTYVNITDWSSDIKPPF